MKCKTEPSAAHVPDWTGSTVSDRVLVYLNPALHRTPWKTNGEKCFRSTHLERNWVFFRFPIPKIRATFYLVNSCLPPVYCCALARYLRLPYLMRFVHGITFLLLLCSRGVEKRLPLIWGVILLYVLYNPKVREALALLQKGLLDHHLKGCLGKPAFLN